MAAFAALGADIAVVAAYGLILPNAIIKAPRLGCINVHASLLPRWRGAAPIHRAILAGDAETGVTIMEVEEKLDAGPILLVEKAPIAPKATAQDLHDALAKMGARLIVEALEGLENGSLRATTQPDDGVTYANKLERGEGKLDWSKPAEELERAVRALNPWPGAWFEHNGERIKVLEAETADGGGEAGCVLGCAPDGHLNVACGSGSLALKKLQRAGKGPSETEDFLRGYPIPQGTKLL